MGVGRDDQSSEVAVELPYDGMYKGTSYIARIKRR